MKSPHEKVISPPVVSHIWPKVGYRLIFYRRGCIRGISVSPSGDVPDGCLLVGQLAADCHVRATADSRVNGMRSPTDGSTEFGGNTHTI